MDDLTLLRLHVEAVWGLRLLPLAYGDHETAPDSADPPWALYSAAQASGRVRIWRRGVTATARRDLAADAEHALGMPAEALAGERIRREVALARRANADAPPLAAARAARRLGPADVSLMEAFEPDLASYLLEPQRSPIFGVVVADRLLSVAHSSRRTQEACELGVNTAPDARRRGYALAVTLLWADAVRAERLVPLYSAMATNVASLALAAAAGYRPFAHAAYL